MSTNRHRILSKDILKTYAQIKKVDSMLDILLQKISALATEATGTELTAFLCNGGELEFRKTRNDISDSNSCIRLEEILNKIKDE